MLSTIRHGALDQNCKQRSLLESGWHGLGMRPSWNNLGTRLKWSGNETRNVARRGTYWESQIGKPGIAKLLSVFLEKIEVMSTCRDNLHVL